jgi:tetratricopeptide (TPR) repeat protein
LLGLRDAKAGRADEGVGRLDRVIHLAEEQDERWLWPLFKGWLGEAHLAAGDSESARRHAHVSLEMSRAQSQRGTEAWAWRLLGEIAAVADPPDHQAAKTRYQEALTRASDLRMRPLVAHCHLGLGTLYRRTGDPVKAHEHLTIAATMYREVGMTLWLERAETALASPEPP